MVFLETMLTVWLRCKAHSYLACHKVMWCDADLQYPFQQQCCWHGAMWCWKVAGIRGKHKTCGWKNGDYYRDIDGLSLKQIVLFATTWVRLTGNIKKTNFRASIHISAAWSWTKLNFNVWKSASRTNNLYPMHWTMLLEKATYSNFTL